MIPESPFFWKNCHNGVSSGGGGGGIRKPHRENIFKKKITELISHHTDLKLSR